MMIGEVFVLDDGGEVDLDLGNYERFLDITLTRDNNITTGKIYQSVIEKEVRIWIVYWLEKRRILGKDGPGGASCHGCHSRLD